MGMKIPFNSRWILRVFTLFFGRRMKAVSIAARITYSVQLYVSTQQRKNTHRAEY
jgi:hypothetical protein